MKIDGMLVFLKQPLVKDAFDKGDGDEFFLWSYTVIPETIQMAMRVMIAHNHEEFKEYFSGTFFKRFKKLDKNMTGYQIADWVVNHQKEMKKWYNEIFSKRSK